MTKPLVVFIDDEPSSALTKISEIGFINDGNADLWLLSPIGLTPTEIEDLILCGVTEVYEDCNRLTPGYSRRDFVQWCKDTLKSNMFRIVAVFIDYMIDEKHPTIKHWQYIENGNKFEGMKDLINYLSNFNPIAKFYVFTQFHEQTENYIDGTIDKSKNLGEMPKIYEAYENLTKRLSVKHKTAWLDRHQFDKVLNKTLLHSVFHPTEAIYACHININYLKYHLTELKEKYPNKPISWLFPSCISNCDCDDDEIDSTKAQEAWKRYYKEFCLFRNPDFSILYSILWDRHSATPRNNANIEPKIFDVIVNDGGLLQLNDLPNEIKVSCGKDTILISIDNSLRTIAQINGENTIISRMDNQVSGRHIDKQYYCVLYPWEADTIGQKIFDNLFPPKYKTKKLTIKSYADFIKKLFIIELVHECEIELFVTPKLKDDSFLVEIGAGYALKNDGNVFTFQIELPLHIYGVSNENPWRG